MNNKIKNVYLTFFSQVNKLLDYKIISAYSCGSASYDDFHQYYSDLDFVIIVYKELTEEDYKKLHDLRDEYKKMNDGYFSVLEGEIISYSCFKNELASCIYWGTKKDMFNTTYTISGFSLLGLLEQGVLLYGQDYRIRFPIPSEEVFIEQIKILIDTIKTRIPYVSDDIHTIDWFFLISQSIYWLYLTEVTSKMQAALWVVENSNYIWLDQLSKAMELRANPSLIKKEEVKAWLRILYPYILEANDTLEKELKNSINSRGVKR